MVHAVMLKFNVFSSNQEPKILCLGAHPDDIEIGCGGSLLRIIDQFPKAKFYWTVFSGHEQRRHEANESAMSFMENIAEKKVLLKTFKDSFFPFIGADIKCFFENELKILNPDLIFTHYRGDAHQDHRLISDLTWTAFRDNLILEYEIPKFDGDLSTPNFYVHLSDDLVIKKIELLLRHFQSQKSKKWFNEETFRAILRLRGIESNSPSQYSEAFYCRKIVI